MKFNVWAMQEERCKTEMFNIVNGDVFSWASVWPLLAQEFGAKIPDNMFADVPATAKKHNYRKYSIEKEMKSPFPTASSSTTKAEYAWKLLCAQDKNLDPEAWKYATWDFVDQVCGCRWVSLEARGLCEKLTTRPTNPPFSDLRKSCFDDQGQKTRLDRLARHRRDVPRSMEDDAAARDCADCQDPSGGGQVQDLKAVQTKKAIVPSQNPTLETMESS